MFAEALIATVARAFYDDEAICLIDVLIRDKFLRDDDMAPRLSLPAKKLRATLQFLQEEHLVRSETVDDLAQGGSQATKFYYLDYNRAVYSIRLRLHLLRKKLEQDELKARSNSYYLCPGYKERRCNGRYTEEEAQQVLDMTTGLFLCQECSIAYQNDPNAPPLASYTLKLVDNAKDLKLAVDNLRRVNVQLSAKFIGNDQMRAGIYDLLQKVRGKGKAPITSNLPSENFALGIGSKRLAGTGRTAGIKAKKLEQQGVANSAAQARMQLVGGASSRQSGEGDLMFLKTAMGHEIQFTVERGGGARAQLLATKRRRQRKLMDLAASRVGASLPVHLRFEEQQKRKKAEKEEEENAKEEELKRKKKAKVQTFEFLRDNIGRHEKESQMDNNSGGEDGCDDENDEYGHRLVLEDETVELRKLSEEKRLAAFQAQYKLEMDRQSQLMHLEGLDPPPSPNTRQLQLQSETDEDPSLVWEDGEMN